MSPAGEQILQRLREVASERNARTQDAALAARVLALKQFQQQRFAATYADLLASPRYAAAARFFLDDLYGPSDFAERDDQFARVVPALVRLFPQEIVETVLALARLHALSERLDTAMAAALTAPARVASEYAAAWRAVGRREERQAQIELMLDVGRALERYTRNPLLRHTLRLMRGPAQAASLAALQRFLEEGFETFRRMQGAGEFLDTIAQREQALAARLFDGGDIPGAPAAPA